jgi:tellurium resistance protein TerD
LAEITFVKKGQKVALTGVERLTIGLGWETPPGAVSYDLDACAFMNGSGGKVLSDEHFVFFNNLSSPDGTVVHAGDSLTGDGGGDDEQIHVNLVGMSPDVQEIVVVVSIYLGRARGQKFGDLDNAYMRLVGGDGEEILRFPLTGDDVSDETSLIFGRLYRHNGSWKFDPVAQGRKDGFSALVSQFGVDVDADPNDVEGVVVAAPDLSPPVPAVSLVKGMVNLKKGEVAHASATPGQPIEISLYWDNPYKDLGLIFLVRYRGGRSEVLDWRQLRSHYVSSMVHHGDRKAGGADVREYVTAMFSPSDGIESMAVVAYSELSNGVGSFYSMGARAVIKTSETTINVPLNKKNPVAYHVVIAQVTFSADGRSFEVRPVSRYSQYGSERRPELLAGGRIKMNSGEVVFKGHGGGGYNWW